MKQSSPLRRSDGDLRFSEQLASAKGRLRDKLLHLDVKPLDLSEYNQRYLGEKISRIENVLELYGRLLTLSLSNSPIPLQRFVLVDYGGGSGVLSFLAKEMGVGTVVYNDIYNVSCNDVRLLSRALALPLDHIVCGDVDELVSYARINSIYVNAITSYDVLEHIYDVKSHFGELASLAADHFRVVYGSGANIENPWYVHAVTKKQREAEYKNREREWGCKERDTLRAFLDVRRDMIADFAPELTPEQVEQLARSTRGLRKDDIEKCIDEYRKKGNISYQPDNPTNTCDPYTGNWTEHLMSSQWLEQVLQESSFVVKILAGYYSVSGSPLPKRAVKYALNAAIYLLGRRGLFISPYYVVYAKRE